MELSALRALVNRYQSNKTKNYFRVEMDGGIAVVTFDDPGEKINKWSTPATVALFELMDELESKQPEGVVFISAKPTIFIAGADVNEIRGLKGPEDGYEVSVLGQRIFQRWEQMAFPTVAAIHGATMGGGCEFVLSCTVRICTDDPVTRIGLPEVMLGILPGWGGTQRLPRQVGLVSALDIILAGKAVGSRQAKKMGLVQDVVPREILKQTAVEWIRSGKAQKFNKYRVERGLKEGFMESALGRPVVYAQAQKQLLERTLGNYPAPLAALRVVKKTFSPGRPHDEGFEIEAREFSKLVGTPECKNLVEVFFMSEAAKKTVYPVKDPVKPLPVSQVAVLGAGVMGAGIAQVAIGKGTKTFLKDINEEALGRGLSTIASSLDKQVRRKRIQPREKAATMAKLQPVTDVASMKNVQIVIEAIVEKLDVKQSTFVELEKVLPRTAVLATNTSTLSVKDIAAKCQRPEQVVGIHFFNPVDKMPLVEIVMTEKSDAVAVATALDFVKKLGKTPVVCKDSAGFVVNRILGPYLNEAGHMAASGAPLEAVDVVLKKFGMPMGPYRLMDEVGLDVCDKASHILHQAFGDRMRPPGDWLKAFIDKKMLGKKSKHGFYLYEGKKERFDNDVYRLLGAKVVSVSSTDELRDKWVKRLIYPMINEAARVLEEKIVEGPTVVDTAMIMGTGFAPFRGGLLRYADSIGTKQIVADLEEMASLYNSTERFKPSGYLKNLASQGKGFYS
jgi:3-hydroxyacyl-CoA dehydrogenase/enoyl-CoA hydratase/3-hydroxybutyryl-CoA epimerase